MSMMKGQDAFERSLKGALEQYEVPYNSADWAHMEKRLNDERKSSWSSSVALYLLLLGGSIAVASAVQQLVSAPMSSMAANAITLNEFPTSEVPVNIELPIDASEEELVASDGGSERAVDPNISKTDVGSKNDVPKKKENAAVGIKPELAVVATVPSKASISIRPSATEGCPGSSVEFAVENMPKDGMHLWNFGDGSFSNKPAPEHIFSKAGTYEVMLSHSATGRGAIENKPASDLIVIHEAPEASFKALKQEYDNTVPSVHFENRSQGAKKYLWEFGDGTTSSVAHPDHVFKKQGSYPVTLTVTNAKGCIDRVEETVRIAADYDLYAPKTFSPNEDGRDDVFIPEALKTLGVKFHMTIYNAKTGQLVHETSDISHPWNGRIGNKGEMCSTGDYMWMVEMKDGEKLGGSYTGTISLLR